MHIINDIEAFFEEIKETVYHWFGNGVNGENGKEAINLVILNHASPVITGTLTPIETPAASLPIETAPTAPEVAIPEAEIPAEIVTETSVETPNNEVQNG